MLDTGCTRTCVRENAKFLSNVTVEPSNTQIICANNESMNCTGSAKFELTFNDDFRSPVHALVVKHLSAQIILGMDVIRDIVIKHNSKFVFLNGHKLRLCDGSNNPVVCYIKEQITLEPHTETFLRIKNPVSKLTNYPTVAINALNKQKFSDNLTVSPSLNENDDSFHILITNRSHKRQHLSKKMPICTVEPVNVEKCTAVKELPDSFEESEMVKEFQVKRLAKARAINYEPKMGSFGDILGEEQALLQELVQKHRLAFSMDSSDLGKLGHFAFTLPLHDERDTAHQPSRPIPVHLKEKVNQEMQNWIDLGIVEETQSGFNIPLIILKKPDNSIRISLDARQLNTKLKPDRFPLPHMTDTLNKIGTKLSSGKDCYVSTFDFHRGYWNVRVDESDKHKLAFSHNQRHYCATRMLYGTSTAPSCFSRIMSKLFGDHPSFLLYLDDLIIIDKSLEDHLESLEFLFSTCQKYGLLLSPKKCHLAKQAISFLGHQIDKDGLKPLIKHVVAVRDFPRPVNKQELKRFLGLVNFNLKFCENAAICLKPLHDACSIKREFSWQIEQQTAFDEIKLKLQNAPGLRHRNPNLEMVLVTDASLHGVGGTLYQIEGDEWQTIGYFSKPLSPADKRRPMRVKELLGLCFGIRSFEYYLLNAKFTIVSDHKSLLYLYKEHLRTQLDAKLTNIFFYLNNFEYTIVHSPGASPVMASADCLSRLPKSTLQELADHCDEGDIPDRIFTLMHLPHSAETETTTPMKRYLRALASGNEKQIPICDAEPKGKTLLKFMDYNFNEADMKDKQEQCKTIANIRAKLLRKSKRTLKSFVLENDILFNTRKNMKRIVLPDGVAEEFLRYCHTSYGHCGSKQLSNIISKNVYVSKLNDRCNETCRLCVDCLRSKSRKMIRPSLIKKRSFEDTPWSKTSIDLFDLGKADNRNKRYLVTACDHLTGFLEAVPISNKTEKLVTDAVLQIILRHGLNGRVITDNGCEFSQGFTDVLDKFRIIHVKTAAYMSRSNGKVERVHKELVSKLKLLDTTRSTWSHHYNYIQFLINNLPKGANDGLSAAEALYGRSLFVPFEVIDPVEGQTEPYIQALNRYLQELHPSLMKFQYTKYNRLLEKDHENTPILKLKSQALIWKPDISQGKLSKNWAGPYKVAKRLSKHTYLLIDETTKRRFKRNIRHLRPLVTAKQNARDEQIDLNIDTNQNNKETEKETEKEINPDKFEDEFTARRNFNALPFGVYGK